MLLSRGMNQLEDGICMLQDDDDLELWNKEGQAAWMTAQLCLMLSPDKIAVLHLGAPTCDSDVSGCDLDALGEPAEPWQELPFGMLRWARTIVAGAPGHRSGQGFDVILNLYCLGTLAEDGTAFDGADAHEHAAPTAMQQCLRARLRRHHHLLRQRTPTHTQPIVVRPRAQPQGGMHTAAVWGGW
jgi:hypothetical protein